MTDMEPEFRFYLFSSGSRINNSIVGQIAGLSAQPVRYRTVTKISWCKEHKVWINEPVLPLTLLRVAKSTEETPVVSCHVINLNNILLGKEKAEQAKQTELTRHTNNSQT